MSDWEQVESFMGPYLERWECAPPLPGIPFVVVRDEWEHTDPPKRTIKEIRTIEQT